MVDTAKLRGKIAENGLSQKKVAQYLGISSKTFYLKMQKGVFDSDEICQMIDLLKLSDPAAIFFASNGT